jgi:RNA polymerase sigma-70 factor (ECF subfamily)
MSNASYSIGRFTVEFVERLIARDNSAWRELQAVLHDRLMQVARKAGLSHESAEECVQETVFSVFKRIDSFRGKEVDLQPGYFITIAINYCLRVRERDSRNPVRSSTDLSSPQASDEGGERLVDRLATDAHPSGAASLEDRELVAIMLSHLTDQERELLMLRFVDGLTLDELAQHYSTPLGTIYARLESLKKRLRKLFPEERGLG